MATLSRFKQNMSKITEGEWVDLGEDWGNLKIKTRGFTDAYHDARQARMRRASIKFGGEAKIPPQETRKILGELLLQHCLLDVDNLEDEKGNKVPFDTFKELILEDAYQDLQAACLVAANKLTAEREEDIADAKKNSPTP